MTAPKVICQMSLTDQGNLMDYVRQNRRWVTSPTQMVQANGHRGQTVNICGAGPSLAEHHDQLRTLPAHQTWGCNSGLLYLQEHDLPATHGFCVDQTVEMLGPAEWERTFDVTYLLASSVHPTLVQHLLAAKRRVRWFHNYLGTADPEGWVAPTQWLARPGMKCYEMYVYETTWPDAPMAGYGLNSVPRAIGIAAWMGFKTIRVFGADCAAAPKPWTGEIMPSQADPQYASWLDTVQLYASGRTPRGAYGDTAIMIEAILCDDKTCDCRGGHPRGANVRMWYTRPDMVISAAHLVDIATRMQPGRVELVGDTLPNVMLGKPKSFFEAIPQLTGKGSIAGFSLTKDALALATPLAETEENAHVD